MTKRSLPTRSLAVTARVIDALIWALVIYLLSVLAWSIMGEHRDPEVRRKLTIIQQPAPSSFRPELIPETRCDIAQASLLRLGWPVLLRSADDPTEAVIVPAHWRVVRVQYAANLATVDCSRKPR
jgi:hypothetical protein